MNVNEIFRKLNNKAYSGVRRAAQRLEDEARRGLTVDRNGVVSLPGEFPTTQSTFLKESVAKADTSGPLYVEFTVSLGADYAETLSRKDRLMLGTFAEDMRHELERLMLGN